MPSKKPVKAAPEAGHDDPDLALITRLAGILNETGLTDIELDRKGTRVRVSKTVTAAAAPHAPAVFHAPAPAAAEPAAAQPKPTGDHPGTVKSPMVGTVYLAPSPGAAFFIEVGSAVKEGQTLLIIEAMKVMNPIKSPRAGMVGQVLVGNSEPVEYGQPLIVID